MWRLKQKCSRVLCVVLLFSLTDRTWCVDEAKVLEKKLDFPSPVQWKGYGGLEISLIGVAWGPANSPQMLSKGREKTARDNPEFYPDRPYALALRFRAKIGGALSLQMTTVSGLGRVKNVDGDIEVPMELTTAGFVGLPRSNGVFDVHFDKNNTTEYWDVFPVSADQKEFLFQVFHAAGLTPSATPLSFRIVLKDGDIVIIGATPKSVTPCLDFKKNFMGTVGAGVRVNLQLAAENAVLSGTEQYQRVGKTLWLTGAVDSLGEFTIEERYPEDQVTGIFKGKFSEDCQVMSGYFSKPDGSRLQPFEFREPGKADGRSASQSDSGQDERE